ncbi:MAG: glycosyltransferase family 2 protein [Lachnospiraceae bacterium]|nr:glycosyltransferase family 2 protein [Lachnospiraceae bacterium]
MELQLLVSAVDKKPRELAEQMNISSDAIIVNQGQEFAYDEFERKGHTIKAYSFAERGVGLSRNNALLRADRDICLFSDEDIVYSDDYEKLVLDEFRKNPEADMILFNIDVGESRRTYHIDSYGKVKVYNSGRYPTYSFAAKVEKLHKNNITFSLLFGGGAKYSNGEDSLFIREVLKKGLKVYKAPVTLGRETERESTWFSGYHEKFFYDRGVLYHYLYGRLAKLIALRFLLKHKNVMCQEIPWKKAYTIMRKGIKEAK